MSNASSGESSGEFFLPHFKNHTEKHALDASHSIEGVRTLFMMHEAMSELRAELLKKDQELLALKRDLEEERSRGIKLASKVGELRRTVFPTAESSVKSFNSVASSKLHTSRSNRHSCSVQYSINRAPDAFPLGRQHRKTGRKCVKKGVWEVAALTRLFPGPGLSASMPDISVDERSDGEDDDFDASHSTCSTTSLLAAAESFKAVSGSHYAHAQDWAGYYHRGSAPNLTRGDDDRPDFDDDVGMHFQGPNVEIDIPVLPRKPKDILPGCRVKYFHPNGRVFAGKVVQTGNSNGTSEPWVWCTRESSRENGEDVVAIPWTKVIVCFRKQIRSYGG